MSEFGQIALLVGAVLAVWELQSANRQLHRIQDLLDSIGHDISTFAINSAGTTLQEVNQTIESVKDELSEFKQDWTLRNNLK